MLLTIEKIKKIITPICIKYGVDRLYLFGSYARQEATASSDIDFRIEKGSIQDLFALSAFRIDLVEALGIEVDIVSAAPISPNEILLFQSSHGQDNFFKAHRKEVYALAKKNTKKNNRGETVISRNDPSFKDDCWESQFAEDKKK